MKPSNSIKETSLNKLKMERNMSKEMGKKGFKKCEIKE